MVGAVVAHEGSQVIDVFMRYKGQVTRIATVDADYARERRGHLWLTARGATVAYFKPLTWSFWQFQVES